MRYSPIRIGLMSFVNVLFLSLFYKHMLSLCLLSWKYLLCPCQLFYVIILCWIQDWVNCVKIWLNVNERNTNDTFCHHVGLELNTNLTQMICCLNYIWILICFQIELGYFTWNNKMTWKTWKTDVGYITFHAQYNLLPPPAFFYLLGSVCVWECLNIF